jgi:hypothetical protein
VDCGEEREGRGGRRGRGGRGAEESEMDVVFDEGSSCNDVTISAPLGHAAVKKGLKEHSSFAIFGSLQATGLSQWRVRIDALSGVMFVGVIRQGYRPRDGLARKLVTPAWMLSSYGYVCSTGGQKGHEALTEKAKAQVGNSATGALSFAAGDVVTISLCRDTRTVTFQVGSQTPFTLEDVLPTVRPFVNLSCRGDAVTLLDGSEKEAHSQEDSRVLPAQASPQAEISEAELDAIRAAADTFWN